VQLQPYTALLMRNFNNATQADTVLSALHQKVPQTTTTAYCVSARHDLFLLRFGRHCFKSLLCRQLALQRSSPTQCCFAVFPDASIDAVSFGSVFTLELFGVNPTSCWLPPVRVLMALHMCPIPTGLGLRSTPPSDVTWLLVPCCAC